MTARAWRQLRRNWGLQISPRLLWQSFVAGPWFSGLNLAQAALTAERRRAASLTNSIFVLGYWRSGTTLLHTYLCHDKRFGFASTYACMQPQHFMLTHSSALKTSPAAVRRPMDEVEVSAASPQEDEFALLALGARSPYEALMAPDHLAEALALSDPRDLHADEAQRWRDTFLYFLSGVSIVEAGRPLILKSPPHGYRVASIRQLLPDARFVLIVRSPETVYESTVRMWRSLFRLYALQNLPPEQATRRAVLSDRPRFESKLHSGLEGLAPDRFVQIHYEQLVRDPVQVMGRLYEQLRLGGFSEVEHAMKAELTRRGQYTASNALPPEYWLRQVQSGWRSIFEQYGYTLGP